MSKHRGPSQPPAPRSYSFEPLPALPAAPKHAAPRAQTVSRDVASPAVSAGPAPQSLAAQHTALAAAAAEIESAALAQAASSAPAALHAAVPAKAEPAPAAELLAALDPIDVDTALPPARSAVPEPVAALATPAPAISPAPVVPAVPAAAEKAAATVAADELASAPGAELEPAPTSPLSRFSRPAFALPSFSGLSMPYVPMRRLLLVGGCSVLAGTALATGLVASANAGSEPPRPPVAKSAPPIATEPVAEEETEAGYTPAAVLPEREKSPKPRRQSPVADQDISEVPEVAVAAYQRAVTVMSDSQIGCDLRWTTLAAVARVESDHGRRGGGDLDETGAASPAVYGATLDGKKGRAKVRDTDKGKVDDLRGFDRPAGPLGFLPNDWAVYGVDADGDGRRDVQDIDDAALALAVQLCATERDLTDDAALRRALGAHRDLTGYADEVLKIDQAYADDVAKAEASAEVELPVVVVKEPLPDPDAEDPDAEDPAGEDGEDGEDDSNGQGQNGQGQNGQGQQGQQGQGDGEQGSGSMGGTDRG